MTTRMLYCAVLAALAVPLVSYADTVTIAADPNAPTSNFQNPGNTATVGYTINTSGNGTSVIVAVSTTDLAHALPFANLYFETDAYDTTQGSNLGFEASATGVTDAFIPSTGARDYNTTAANGFSSVETIQNGVETITVTLPDSYFETDPDGLGFPLTTDGAVSLHLSQSFSYSVVGGSTYYPRPDELGLADVGASSVTPEPPSAQYMVLAMLCAALAYGRKYMQTRRVCMY